MKKLILIFTLLFAAQINAATFTVTRNDDRNEVCNSGVDCSLREAVKAANSVATDDSIDFAQNLTTVSVSTQLEIENAGALIINGRGANFFTIKVRGSDNTPEYGTRIFYTNNATVTITDLTLRGAGFGGPPTNPGGAIFANGGTLVLDRVHVTENYNSTLGGGLYYSGGINHRITNSTISNNRTTQQGLGAGFALAPSTPLYIANTTISGNRDLSGTFNSRGSAFVGSPVLRNVTVANHGTRNGLPYIGGPDMRNTIVLYNEGGSSFPTSCRLTGDNLLGSCNASGIIGPLQDNGGPTPTHALMPGSIAVDAGNNAFAVDPVNNNPLQADQRGFLRIVDGDLDQTAIVDLGAYEASSNQANVNLIANPSFEQGDTAWEDWGNSVVTPANAVTGNESLQIGTGAGGRAQTVAALPETTYLLTGWGLFEGAFGSGWIGVYYLDAAGNQIAPQSLVQLNNPWASRPRFGTQGQLTIRTPPNTASLRVWAWKNPGTGYSYVDHLSLVATPNLLLNPGFEEGDAGWGDWGNSRVTSFDLFQSAWRALEIGTNAGGRFQTYFID